MEDDKTVAALQFLYLTTTGRKSGLAREIEIWFVVIADKFYLLAEHFDRAQWVMNIRHNGQVRVRVGEREFAATAGVLDQTKDKKLWQTAQRLAREKYGWGDGLPVEISEQ